MDRVAVAGGRVPHCQGSNARVTRLSEPSSSGYEPETSRDDHWPVHPYGSTGHADERRCSSASFTEKHGRAHDNCSGSDTDVLRAARHAVVVGLADHRGHLPVPRRWGQRVVRSVDSRSSRTRVPNRRRHDDRHGGPDVEPAGERRGPSHRPPLGGDRAAAAFSASAIRRQSARSRALFDGFAAPIDAAQSCEHFRRLALFARDGRLTHSLVSDETVQLVLATMAQPLPDRYSAGPTSKPSVADAVASLRMLEHLLRPLRIAPAFANLSHAASNGLGVMLAMTAKWEWGTPFLLTEHGLYLRERYIAYGPLSMPHHQRAFMLGFFRNLAAAAYHAADVVAPGSEYNRSWEIVGGADPASIQPIYNGIHAPNFGVSESEPDVPTLAWVGRIDPLKDVKTLLRTFALVRESIPNARSADLRRNAPGQRGLPARVRAAARPARPRRERHVRGSRGVDHGRLPRRTCRRVDQHLRGLSLLRAGSDGIRTGDGGNRRRRRARGSE